MSEEKTVTEIALEGVAQTEIIMLRYFITLLEKFGDNVPMLLNELREDLSKKEAAQK